MQENDKCAPGNGLDGTRGPLGVSRRAGDWRYKDVVGRGSHKSDVGRDSEDRAREDCCVWWRVVQV